MKYEDLSFGEKEVLHGWMDSLSRNELSIDKIKDNISLMKESVENELSKVESSWFTWFLGWKRDFSLKARLRNYMLLEGFLDSPEKAKKALAMQIEGLAKRKSGSLDNK